MHLFVKYLGTTERFDNVEDWTFEHFCKAAKDAFNLEELVFGLLGSFSEMLHCSSFFIS